MPTGSCAAAAPVWRSWSRASDSPLRALSLPRRPPTAVRRADPCGWMPTMKAEDILRQTNRNMIVFDLLLGAGAIAAPEATLRVLGHEPPSPDATHLFRRCGPIWLTFAAAHAVAELRDEPEDWWALAWLRGTEIATDALWSQSSAIRRPGAKQGLWIAGAFNLALAAGSGIVARRRAARNA